MRPRRGRSAPAWRCSLCAREVLGLACALAAAPLAWQLRHWLRAIRSIRPTSTLPAAVVTSFDSGHPELAGLPKDVAVIRLGKTLADDLALVLTNVGELSRV